MPEQTELAKESIRPFLIKAFVLMFVPAVAARLLSFAYAACVTDVTVSPVLTAVLNYTAIAMTCAMCGAAYASITSGVYYRSASAGIAVLIIFSAVFFADCAVSFMSDYVGGEMRYREIVGIITLMTEFFSQAAIAMCAWMISVAFRHLHGIAPTKRIYTVTGAAVAAISLHFIVPLVRWIITVVSFLREVDFIPTSAEVVSIFSDLAVILVIYAGVTVIFGMITLRIVTKNNKIQTNS